MHFEKIGTIGHEFNRVRNAVLHKCVSINQNFNNSWYGYQQLTFLYFLIFYKKYFLKSQNVNFLHDVRVKKFKKLKFLSIFLIIEKAISIQSEGNPI